MDLTIDLYLFGSAEDTKLGFLDYQSDKLPKLSLLLAILM